MKRKDTTGIKWLKKLSERIRAAVADREMTGQDGQRYVRRYEALRVGPIDLGIAGRERWFPLVEADTDRLGVYAALGGWFGLHRFAIGEPGEGLLYLITCGCAGVLPAVDILQLLTGTWSLMQEVEIEEAGILHVERERVYLTRPAHPILMLLCIPTALLVSCLVLKFLYFGLFRFLLIQLCSILAAWRGG